MGIETFKMILPGDRTPKEKQERLDAVRIMKNNTNRAGPCWLCGYKCAISKWSAHLERHRKEGWKPRDSKARRPAAVVFAEWQQQDATPEDYGSLGEYRRLTGQK